MKKNSPGNKKVDRVVDSVEESVNASSERHLATTDHMAAMVTVVAMIFSSISH